MWGVAVGVGSASASLPCSGEGDAVPPPCHRGAGKGCPAAVPCDGPGQPCGPQWPEECRLAALGIRCLGRLSFLSPLHTGCCPLLSRSPGFVGPPGQEEARPRPRAPAAVAGGLRVDAATWPRVLGPLLSREGAAGGAARGCAPSLPEAPQRGSLEPPHPAGPGTHSGPSPALPGEPLGSGGFACVAF